MVIADLNKATTSSGLDQSLKIQTTEAETLENAGANGNEWQSSNWGTYLAYYKNHIPARAVINKLAMWSVGKGFKSDEKTKKILDGIRGWGKESFNNVIDNSVRVEHINGDSYCEIITSDGELIKEDGSNLLNLKPIDPAKMKHLVNEGGFLTGYKQTLSDGKEVPYEVEEIFHLSLNRVADEIHGTGDIASMTTYLDKIKQLDEDMTIMFHRFVVPLIIWKLNTNDATAITNFKTQEASAINTGKNMVIPEEAVEWSLLEAGKNGVDPMQWRNKWTEEVIKGGGVPALIMAIEAGTTEASSKMVYLAWQQVVEDEQLNLETQIKNQLGLEVEFNFPAQIQENLGDDEKKDGEIDKPVNVDPEKKE